jgi:hypothetical protein
MAVNNDQSALRKPLPDKTLHFALSNDGKQFRVYFDGVEVSPQSVGDFTLEGWRYSNEYVNKLMKRTKWQRVKQLLLNHRSKKGDV